MRLRVLGSTSKDGQSPTLFETDRDTVLVQGWRVTDPEALGQMSIPGHETVVEVPRELLRFAPRQES